MTVTPAAAAWLFGDEEVAGRGRWNTKVPSGSEVDGEVLAGLVVMYAAFGLRERGLLALEPLGQDDVRVTASADTEEPTVEGLLFGLFHERRPEPGRLVKWLSRVPSPDSLIDRFAPGADLSRLGSVVVSGPSAERG